MTETNTRILFNSAPDGMPTPDNFRIDHVPAPQPGEGQFLLRNQWSNTKAAQRPKNEI